MTDAASPYERLLADLLLLAKTEDCGCETCRTLRASWTLLSVDDAVGRARPDSVCAQCWESSAPAVQRMRLGLVVATVGEAGRCALCGMPALERPTPRPG